VLPQLRLVDGAQHHGFLHWLATITATIVLPGWAVILVVYLTNAVSSVWQAVTG
jgi:hypothetical protein